ncbi:MAG: NAD(P)-binding domain-containing protein [Bdellovibrionota bacterium]
MPDEMFNVVVVGGGPAGVSVAAEALQAGIDRVLVLEKGDTHNYMINKLYTVGKRVDTVWKGIDAKPEGILYITPGNRETYLHTMEEYIQKYNVQIRYKQDVWQIKRADDGSFNINVGPKEIIKSRTVVLAIGVMGRPNKPSYPIPPALKGRIHFDLTSANLKGARVLVIGGGDTASEAVQYLQPDNQVVFSYRQAKLSRMNEINEKILLELGRKKEAELWYPSDVEKLEATPDGKCKVIFKDGSKGSAKEETFDHVVYCLGGSSPTGFLKSIGLEFNSQFPQVNPDTHETDIPGLYLAGDLALEGKGSITTAFNTGRRIVEKGLCVDHFSCTITPAGEVQGPAKQE